VISCPRAGPHELRSFSMTAWYSHRLLCLKYFLFLCPMPETMSKVRGSLLHSILHAGNVSKHPPSRITAFRRSHAVPRPRVCRPHIHPLPRIVLSSEKEQLSSTFTLNRLRNTRKSVAWRVILGFLQTYRTKGIQSVRSHSAKHAMTTLFAWMTRACANYLWRLWIA
jgi:hypothetical protein